MKSRRATTPIRSTAACWQCKSAKSKCSLSRPCNRCIQRGNSMTCFNAAKFSTDPIKKVTKILEPMKLQEMSETAGKPLSGITRCFYSGIAENSPERAVLDDCNFSGRTATALPSSTNLTAHPSLLFSPVFSQLDFKPCSSDLNAMPCMSRTMIAPLIYAPQHTSTSLPPISAVLRTFGAEHGAWSSWPGAISSSPQPGNTACMNPSAADVASMLGASCLRFGEPTRGLERALRGGA